jgi:hypothetical protein
MFFLLGRWPSERVTLDGAPAVEGVTLAMARKELMMNWTGLADGLLFETGGQVRHISDS